MPPPSLAPHPRLSPPGCQSDMRWKDSHNNPYNSAHSSITAGCCSYSSIIIPTLLRCCACRAALLLIKVISVNAAAQGTSFSYQGRLNDANGPATGIYEFQFSIYDAAVNP